MPYLEHYPKQGGSPVRVELTAFPFRLGRSRSCQFVILSNEVSKEHAEIFLVGNEYRVRDLRSTNGTLVNSSRITEAALPNNACIRLGDETFWFRTGSEDALAEWGTHTIPISKLKSLTS